MCFTCSSLLVGVHLKIFVLHMLVSSHRIFFLLEGDYQTNVMMLCSTYLVNNIKNGTCNNRRKPLLREQDSLDNIGMEIIINLVLLGNLLTIVHVVGPHFTKGILGFVQWKILTLNLNRAL